MAKRGEKAGGNDAEQEGELKRKRYVGQYVLRMNPLILLGACSGGGTITAALRALPDEAQSKVPTLGYTVPYAIGNIPLTAWGTGPRGHNVEGG